MTVHKSYVGKNQIYNILLSFKDSVGILGCIRLSHRADIVNYVK